MYLLFVETYLSELHRVLHCNLDTDLFLRFLVNFSWIVLMSFFVVGYLFRLRIIITLSLGSFSQVSLDGLSFSVKFTFSALLTGLAVPPFLPP